MMKLTTIPLFTGRHIYICELLLIVVMRCVCVCEMVQMQMLLLVFSSSIFDNWAHHMRRVFYGTHPQYQTCNHTRALRLERFYAWQI